MSTWLLRSVEIFFSTELIFRCCHCKCERVAHPLPPTSSIEILVLFLECEEFCDWRRYWIRSCHPSALSSIHKMLCILGKNSTSSMNGGGEQKSRASCATPSLLLWPTLIPAVSADQCCGKYLTAMEGLISTLCSSHLDIGHTSLGVKQGC